jgi:ribokinase
LIGFGINPEGLMQDDVRPTGMAFILVDQGGKNQIAVAPGANYHLLSQDILSLQDILLRGQTLLVQLEVPLETVRCALEIAKGFGMTTILDPAPSRPLSPDILSLLDFITPNEVEAEYLTGLPVKNSQEAGLVCQRLLDLGVDGAIITMAAGGAFFHKGDQKGYFPAFVVPSVDSTAAGDAFNGALACALSEGKTLPEAMVMASAAGALATTKLGAQPSLPTRSEIETLLHRHEIRKER